MLALSITAARANAVMMLQSQSHVCMCTDGCAAPHTDTEYRAAFRCVLHIFTTEIFTNRTGFGCFSCICLIENNTKEVLKEFWFYLFWLMLSCVLL